MLTRTVPIANTATTTKADGTFVELMLSTSTDGDELGDTDGEEDGEEDGEADGEAADAQAQGSIRHETDDRAQRDPEQGHLVEIETEQMAETDGQGPEECQNGTMD